MKTSISMIAALLVVGSCLLGCQKASDSKPAAAAGAGGTQYTCSMHPEVVQNEPGKCPKCGMDLIEKK